MASFEGFGALRTDFNSIVTGKWYAYASLMRQFIFLACSDARRNLALRLELSATDDLIKDIAILSLTQVEAPFYDVTDRLVFKPTTSLRFGIPKPTSGLGIGVISSIADGGVVMTAKDEFGTKKFVNLSTGQVYSDFVETGSFPEWELYSKDGTRLNMVAQFDASTVRG